MKRKIFFAGQYWINNGPSIVNKNIVLNLPKYIARLHFCNRYLMRIECFCRILWCDVFILSALGHKKYEILLAKLLHKKIIYIMHGFAKDDSEFLYNLECSLLPQVDLILCVSKPFANQVKSCFPEFAYKIDVLTNGIAWKTIENQPKESSKVARDAHEIILIGGGRLIKQNLIVCKAIQQLNEEESLSLHVSVYGQYNDNDESKEISSIPCVSFQGLVSHRVLMDKLRSSHLLIQNSRVESFGLAVIEALICGCDILISKNVGAIEVIKGISNSEIIENSLDLSEIKTKILYILKHSNNGRLLNSIDKVKTSFESTVKRMEFIANNL